MFVHLHGHSHYSLLEAIGKPKEILAAAKEYGMTAIALTDYYGMYGCVEFYKTATTLDIKPIIGVDLGLVEDMLNKERNETSGNITLLAKSYDGYQNLMQLVSHANLEGFHGKPRIDYTRLQEYKQDIICLIGGCRSSLQQILGSGSDTEKGKDHINRLIQIFGKENCGLLLTAQDHQEIKGLEVLNTATLSLAQETGLPIGIDGNYHYLNKEDKKPFEIALSIKDGKRVFDEGRRIPQGDMYLMNEDEIRKVLQKNGYADEQITDWFENNQLIADACNVKIPLDTILFPKYQSPKEIKELYEQQKDSLLLE